VAGVKEMLAAPAGESELTLPGLFASEPPASVSALLAEIAADVRPATAARQVAVIAEADQRDLLSIITAPTLLIWGEQDRRSPLSVAAQFEQAIPDARLVVIRNAGHASNLEQPDLVNEAIREFCRAHQPS
jgi:pimeloyl-ACP methyl ester carboxylesterase